MKQLLYSFVFCCLALWGLTACEQDSGLDSVLPDAVSNSIVLDFGSSLQPAGRALEATASAAEKRVNHLDVFIFEANGSKVWYERVQGTSPKSGKVTLSVSRKKFTPKGTYQVYVVANSTASITTFQPEKFDLNQLKALMQEDKAIYLTGLDNLTGVPASFLMDGKAYSGTDEKNTDVVLNDGNPSANTELKVTLRRAAAKILVHIHKGDKVTFDTEPTQHNAGYYLRNLPFTTSVIPGEKPTPKLRTPAINSGGYFSWTANQVTVTAYAYSHTWEQGTALVENGVRLIVNVPLIYQAKSDGEGVFYENSFYQIPISKDYMLLRNTCYEVNVTLNAPGANNPLQPVVLSDVQFTVAPWTMKEVAVGGESDRPSFLTLNQYELEMHNLKDDRTTLEFASSSDVTAKITKVWYIDKFGQEKVLEYDNEKGQYGEKYTTGSGGWFDPVITHWKNLCTVTVTPDQNISGNIHVHSDLPTNNTIRYITFTLTNEDGITRTVTVAQYPLEYITNIQGWYSYRDDFKDKDSKPTTYEYKGDRIYGISYTSDGQYAYEKSSRSPWNGEQNTGSGFWRSKVATPNPDGSSSIDYYYYRADGTRRESSAESKGNARMYHVRITATSGDYTLGRPRMGKDGYTDPGKDNAQMVSPSFMIASRLGFINSGAGGVDWDQKYALEVARKHCAHYVEVYKDKQGHKVILDDWRLPTSAELKIIMKFQGGKNTNADAIDYLLNGKYYWSASERVYNEKNNNSGSAIRCIRDAYEKNGK